MSSERIQAEIRRRREAAKPDRGWTTKRPDRIESIAECQPLPDEAPDDPQCCRVITPYYEDAPRLCRREARHGSWFCDQHQPHYAFSKTIVVPCRECGLYMRPSVSELTVKTMDNLREFMIYDMDAPAEQADALVEMYLDASIRARSADSPQSGRCNECASRAHVYVIQADKWIKVGVATNVESRARTLETGCPVKPVIVWRSHKLPRQTAYKVESGAHRRLKARHSNGEWFEVTADEAIAVLQSLLSS